MVPPPSPTASPARPVFLLAIAAALGLALSAGSDRAGIATAALDVLPVAALVAVVWAAARARHGERAANGAALALLLFAPVLGAVGGGGALAPLLLIAGGAGLTRCLLDPTVQRIGAAGTCLGLAAAVLEVEGVGRVPTLVAMAVAGVALAGWRVVTAERCESRRRVAHGAAASLALVAAVAAAVLAGVDQLPPLEATEYTRLWPAAAVAAAPAGGDSGWLLALNALSLLILVAARGWRRTGRYADGAALIGLLLALAVGLAAPVLLPLLAAPWLALLAGGALADGRQPVVLRLAAAALVVQVVSAVLLWPAYPRVSDGWAPLPLTSEGVPT